MTAQDRGYLRTVQYRDSAELAKRANLHVRYRTAAISVFELFGSLVPWAAGDRILDVGGGAGWLWESVARELPQGIHLTTTDLSAGMVAEAVPRARATGAYRNVDGRVCDACALPFADATFDVVTSTYALYHVPEPERPLAEMRRVLRPGGTMALMTNGDGHLRQIEDARVAVFGESARYEINRTFTPAMALAALADHFDRVTWTRYDDELHVTDVDDAVAFMTSSPPATDATADQVDALRAIVDDTMHANGGVFRVDKHTGVVVAEVKRPVGR